MEEPVDNYEAQEQKHPEECFCQLCRPVIEDVVPVQIEPELVLA